MTIYDSLIAKAIGGSGGGGGGGSSDFSTAEVTCVPPEGSSFSALCPTVIENMAQASFYTVSEEICTIILYKGTGQMIFTTVAPLTLADVIVTGNIELLVDEGEVYGADVTGDGTITLLN